MPLIRSLMIPVVAWLFCSYASATNTADTARPGSGTQHRGALFKVQDKHHTLYLFGTIHVGAANFYPLEPRVMRALKQAPAVALELDPHKTLSMQAAVLQHGLYPEGQSYQTELSASQQQQLEVALKKYGVPATTVARFRPWMIASLLTVQEFASKGYRSDLAVDGHLANLARQHKQPIVELEGAENQLALFSSLSQAQQNLLLEDTIRELNDPEDAAKVISLAQYWRTADLGGLQQLLDEMAGDDHFANRFTKEVLLDQRNPALTERLASLLHKQDRVFAAIGILHLVGPTGVPALLQQRGLKVERIQ